MIAITGASNQVGATLAPRLLSRGHEVAALGRGSRPAWVAGHPRLRWIRHDLALAPPPGLEAVSRLIHAAPLKYFGSMLDGCPGLQRVVVFSSTSIATKADSRDTGEQAVVRDLAAGEQAVESLCQGRALGWVILRPTIVYGTGLDHSLTRLAAMLRRWPVFPIPGQGLGKRQPVHVEDLARAACQALESPLSGVTYDLPGGETLTYREMLERIARSVGRQPRILCLPRVARWMLPLARLLPRLRDVNQAMLDRIDQDLVFDAEPARRDLAYTPRPFQPRAGHWMRMDLRRGKAGS